MIHNLWFKFVIYSSPLSDGHRVEHLTLLDSVENGNSLEGFQCLLTHWIHSEHCSSNRIKLKNIHWILLAKFDEVNQILSVSFDNKIAGRISSKIWDFLTAVKNIMIFFNSDELDVCPVRCTDLQFGKLESKFHHSVPNIWARNMDFNVESRHAFHTSMPFMQTHASSPASNC